MRRLSVFLLLMMILAAWSTPGEAKTWKTFRFLKLIVNDALDADGRVFVGGTQFLAIPGGSENAYLLNTKDYTVYRLSASEIPMEEGKPMFDPSGGAAMTDMGLFDKDGAILKWRDGERRYTLAPEPPLLDIVEREVILKRKPAYVERKDEYAPSADALTGLAATDREIQIIAAFGTWCSICGDWLPIMMKIEDGLETDTIRLTYIACGEEVVEPAERIAEYDINDVPTFIVRDGNGEIGRITSDDLDVADPPVLEQLILDIVNHAE